MNDDPHRGELFRRPLVLVVGEDATLLRAIAVGLAASPVHVLPVLPTRAVAAVCRAVGPAAVIVDEVSSQGFETPLDMLEPWLSTSEVPVIVLAEDFRALDGRSPSIELMRVPVRIEHLRERIHALVVGAAPSARAS